MGVLSHECDVTCDWHKCHARQCDVQVMPSEMMCRTHWEMVPLTMKRALWAHAIRVMREPDPTKAVGDTVLVHEVILNLIELAQRPRSRDGDFYRASGNVECDTCGFTYYAHPRCVAEPWLHVLCDGRYVKL